MATYWEKDAHSAYDMLSLYMYLHVEKVSSARLIVLAAEGISGTGKSSSVLSADFRFTWRLRP